MNSTAALTAGAASVSIDGGSDAGSAIDYLRQSGLRLSEEFGDQGPGTDNTAALNDFFTYIEGMSGRKGGVVSPWASEVPATIDRSAVDWEGITLVGLPGQSGINLGGNSTSYAVLKLGNLDRVEINGVGFTSEAIKPTEDTGQSLLYSFQKSVLNSSIRRCYFSGPESFTSALTFYARINGADESGLIDGLTVEDCLFENVGRICMTLMNRYDGADTHKFLRKVRLLNNRVNRAGAAAPAYGTTAGYLHGMFVSMDGYGEDFEICGNYLEALQGLGIEIVGSWRDGLIADNLFRDFSNGLAMLSVDDTSQPGGHSKLSILRNRTAGAVTGARHSIFYGMDSTCLLEDNEFVTEASDQAALFVRSGLTSRRDRFTNANSMSGRYGLLIATDCAGIRIEQPVIDMTGTGTAAYSGIRFLGAGTTRNVVLNPVLKLTTHGFAYDERNGAANNVVTGYTDTNGVR